MTSSATPRTVSALAGRVGRGVGITIAFGLLLQLLSGIQSLVVPRLLGPETVGLFALAMAIVRMGNLLKDLGTHQKLVQDRRHGLPLSYSVAFTLEMVVASVLFLLVVALAPLLADFYDERRLGFVVAALATMVYAHAFLELPSALYLRRLDYLRRNLIQAIGPLTNFAVTVPLAFAGAGVWSLVAGSLAALLASVWAVTRGISLRPRLRLDREVLRDYLQFGWPLWVASLLGIASTLGGTVVVSRVLGVAGLGFVSLAQGFVVRVLSVDLLVAQALFPALTATQGDTEGHRKAFQVTNRITMMWASTVGFGFALFAGDLVDHVLGPDWQPAVPLFRAAGVAIGLGSVGFSWDMFFRARGETRPTLVFKIISEGWVFVMLLPLVALYGIAGAAWATAGLGGLALIVRQAFVRRIFPGYHLLGAVWREVGVAGAVAAVISWLRALGWTPESFVGLVVQAATYLAAVGIALVVVDRALLQVLLRAVRRKREPGMVDLASAGDVVDGVDPVAAAGGEPGGDGTLDEPRRSHLPADPISLLVPGEHPVGVASDGTTLWVTCRDSSLVAWHEVDPGRWSTARFPAWPELIAVDEQGTAWSALLLARAVGWCRADGEHGHVRVPRGRHLVGPAAMERGCALLDSENRQLWLVDRGGARRRTFTVELAEPAAIVADREAIWVADGAEPVVARVPLDDRSGSVESFRTPGGAAAAALDVERRLLWLTHRRHPSLSALDLATGEVVDEVELTAAGGAITVVPGVGIAAALTDADTIVIVRLPHDRLPDIELEHNPLPSGARPTGIAPHLGGWWAVSGPHNCLWRIHALDARQSTVG